jgi:hypothetical protein
MGKKCIVVLTVTGRSPSHILSGSISKLTPKKNPTVVQTVVNHLHNVPLGGGI